MKEWIEKAAHDFPPSYYTLTGKQCQELYEAARHQGSIFSVISAAYNIGFKRGRRYEKKIHK